MSFSLHRHTAPWFLAALLVAGGLSTTRVAAQELDTAHATAGAHGKATPIAPRRDHSLGNTGQAGVIQVALRQSRHQGLPAATQHESLPFPDAQLRSEVAFVQDLSSATVLYDQNSDEARPIASISKLMTALVVAESGLSMREQLTITNEDVDRVRHSRSRLAVGTKLNRGDMLHLALMSSENRAAHALGRHYPGGMPAFVRAMNDKARALGMRNTHFVEPTGLSELNVSTPRDLVKLLKASSKEPLIQRYSTDESYQVTLGNGRSLKYNNTNRLVKNSQWDIQLSKTGFINEAGQCLVMVARIGGRDLAIVLLNAAGSYSRIGDAVRLRKFVENETNLAML
ncbi:MAG TPA: D-alanyl-D-alanine endopeptidase [Pusillimonas sp.]|uniref:D-alanyl-D-alanine endopeptidase n=1 Tax=Pusillimonas sp. TaxID=3040095 RepID=UPI002BA07EBE|nr:D-alanyl-D-alanine endopeptidase [Pusillimonas sp.]HUH88176.1 D-alanyl-D-alanine endopeptidase [Pusillimonas sp.]